MTDASATTRPVVAEHAPAPSTTRPIAQVPTGWKNPRALARAWAQRVDLRAGARLADGVGRGRRRSPASARIVSTPSAITSASRGSREEAVVDRQRRARIGRREPHRAARVRLHREHRRADLVAGRAGRVDRREQEEVADALARSALLRACDRDLRHRQRVRALELGGLALEALGRLEAEADADVVDQALADRQAADRPLRSRIPGDPYAPAASTTVCARSSPRGRRHADGAVAVEQHAVDQRVGARSSGSAARAPGRGRRTRR